MCAARYGAFFLAAGHDRGAHARSIALVSITPQTVTPLAVVHPPSHHIGRQHFGEWAEVGGTLVCAPYDLPERDGLGAGRLFLERKLSKPGIGLRLSPPAFAEFPLLHRTIRGSCEDYEPRHPAISRWTRRLGMMGRRKVICPLLGHLGTPQVLPSTRPWRRSPAVWRDSGQTKVSGSAHRLRHYCPEEGARRHAALVPRSFFRARLNQFRRPDCVLRAYGPEPMKRAASGSAGAQEKPEREAAAVAGAAVLSPMRRVTMPVLDDI